MRTASVTASKAVIAQRGILISLPFFPFGGHHAQDEDHGGKNPYNHRATQRNHIVHKYHGCPKPLVHIVQRQYPRELLQEPRHHLDGKESPRKKHHREHYSVCRGGGALLFLRDAGETHPYPAD